MNGLEAAALGALGAAAGLGTLALGVFHPRVPLFGAVVARGRPGRNAVALTFDDGPHPDFTPRVAQLLERAGGRGTFFCVGRQVERHPELASQLVRAGHALENHTYSHNVAWHLFSAAALTEDLRRCQALLTQVAGRAPRYYRPAVGIRNPAVHRAAKALGLPVVTWSRAPRDGARALTDARARALASSTRDGDILVLHDGTLSGNTALRQATLSHLPALLDGLRQRGLSLVTLEALLT